jgi:membrane-associated phospholipid phosphatase
VTTAPSALPPSGMPPKKFWTIWGLGFCLWACALAVASPYDLPLSVAIADPHLPFARLVATYGEWPSWIVIAIALGIVFARPKPGSRLYPAKTASYGLILQALLHPLLITQAIKFFWGRVRFVSLLPDYSNYTPFYIPAGPFISESLPSGHVAMALVLTPLIFYFARTAGWKTTLPVTLVVLVYGLAVSYGRILAGAHYLTDCIFSMGSSFLVAAIVTRFLLNRKRFH